MQFLRKFKKPSSVASILEDLHVKVQQLEEHKVNTSNKIIEAEEDAEAAKLRREKLAVEWTHAHLVLGKFHDLLGI